MRSKTGDPQVDRALKGIQIALDQLSRNRLADGVFLVADLVATVPKRLVHGLGRPFYGWLLVDTTGTDPVYRVETASTDNSNEIWLQSASDTSVKVYVF